MELKPGELQILLYRMSYGRSRITRFAELSMGEVTILDFALGTKAKSNNDFNFRTKPKSTFMTLAL